MRRAAAGIIAAFMMVSGILAAPATKPTVKPAASQPTTAPARVDPAFVADFNEHLLNRKYDDVVTELRAAGAIGQEPKLTSEGGQGKFHRRNYSVALGYAWEYSNYSFAVDDAGTIYKFRFDGWLDGAGRMSAGGWPQGAGEVLSAGNKWYLTHRWPQSVPGFNDGRGTLKRVQAVSPAEAAAKIVEACRKADQATAKALGKPSPLPAVKAADIEVHEWFTPRLAKAYGERAD